MFATKQMATLIKKHDYISPLKASKNLGKLAHSGKTP